MSDTAPIEHPSWLTSGDFTAADEPLRLFAAWLEDATAAEPRDPTAMALATVDADGLPNARMVLLKGVDERGFVFYTNMDSQKGRELDVHPQAALVFHWKSLNRQVRVRGAGRARHRRRGRRLFRHPAEAGADRRLGQQAVGAAGKPARLREGGRALRRQIRARRRCRGRRTGRATASCRCASNSGRTGRSACTTASNSAATDLSAPWSKTRLYP